MLVIRYKVIKHKARFWFWKFAEVFGLGRREESEAGGGGSEWKKKKKPTQTPEHSQIQISSSPEFALWFPHESEEKQGVGRGEKRHFQSPVQSQPPLFPSQRPSSKTFVSSGSGRKPFQTLSCSERAAGRAEHTEINVCALRKEK